MWQTYYNTFWAAAASLLASALARPSAGAEFDGTGARIRRIILGAVVGTAVLSIGLELPNRVKPIRSLVRPESEIEGLWIQKHADASPPKYALVRIQYRSDVRSYMISGRTYSVTANLDSIVVSRRSDWESVLMSAESRPGTINAFYAYNATLWEGSVLHATGMGYINFSRNTQEECDDSRGYYADDQLSRDPTRFEMRRLPDSLSGRFDTDPVGLVREYCGRSNVLGFTD